MCGHAQVRSHVSPGMNCCYEPNMKEDTYGSICEIRMYIIMVDRKHVKNSLEIRPRGD